MENYSEDTDLTGFLKKYGKSWGFGQEKWLNDII